MSVTVQVPISYMAEVVVKGGTKQRNEFFSELVDVTIDVVTPEDAPVALLWEKSYYDRSEDASPTYVHELRWYDGRLWSKLEYDYSGRKPEPVSLERMITTVSNGHSSANPLMVGHDWRLGDAIKKGMRPLDQAQWRSATLSGQSEAFESLQAKAEQIIVIDGMVWEETSEPCYEIRYVSGNERNRDTFQVEAYRYVFVEVKDRVPSNGYETIFRADRYADMVAFAVERWGIEPSQEKNAEIAVLIPEAVSYDDEWPPLHHAVVTAVNSDKSSISDSPIEMMVAWAELRDALNDCPLEETSVDKRSALIATAQDYVEFRLNANSSRHSIKTLKQAFHRWDRRQPETIEINIDTFAR